MAFNWGDLAGVVSSIAAVVPGGQGVAAAAGAIGAQLRDDGELYYLSPFSDPLVKKPAGWDLWPAALVPIGPPQGRVVEYEGERNPKAGVRAQFVGKIAWPSGVNVASRRRSLDQARKELAIVGAMRELERAGIEPSWATFFYRFGSLDGAFDPRPRKPIAHELGSLVQIARSAAMTQGFQVRFMASLPRVVNLHTFSPAQYGTWLSVNGAPLADAARELARIQPLYAAALAREETRLQLEAQASAELEALYLDVMARVRSQLASIDVTQPGAVAQLLETIRSSLYAAAVPQPQSAPSQSSVGVLENPFLGDGSTTLAHEGTRAPQNTGGALTSVGSGLLAAGVVGLLLLAALR